MTTVRIECEYTVAAEWLHDQAGKHRRRFRSGTFWPDGYTPVEPLKWVEHEWPKDSEKAALLTAGSMREDTNNFRNVRIIETCHEVEVEDEMPGPNDWPKHPSGVNKRIDEMTPEEKDDILRGVRNALVASGVEIDF